MRSTRSFIRGPQPYATRAVQHFRFSPSTIEWPKGAESLRAVVNRQSFTNSLQTRRSAKAINRARLPVRTKYGERHSGRVAEVRCRSDLPGHRAVVTRSRGLFGMRKTAGFCLDFGRISSCRAMDAVSLAIECYPEP